MTNNQKLFYKETYENLLFFLKKRNVKNYFLKNYFLKKNIIFFKSINSYYDFFLKKKNNNKFKLILLLEKSFFFNLNNTNHIDINHILNFYLEKDFFYNKKLNEIITSLHSLKNLSKLSFKNKKIFSQIQKKIKENFNNNSTPEISKLHSRIPESEFSLDFSYKLFNILMKHGKKKKIFNLINKSLKSFRIKHDLFISHPNLLLIDYLRRKINPRFYLRKFHFGKKLVLIPYSIKDDKFLIHQLKLFKKALNSRKEISFKNKFTSELKEIFLNIGRVQKLEQEQYLAVKKARPNLRFLRKLDEQNPKKNKKI